MARLGDIGRIITGNTPSTSDTQNYASNDICFVKPSDIASDDVTILDDTEFHIAEYAREKARVLPPRCVLVTCIGIIGKVAINALECSFNQQINAIIPDTQKCVPEYVAYALFNKQAELQSNANAPVVPIMNKSQFSDIKIYIPSLQEQEDVVRKLTRISALISLRKQQIAKLDELVKARFVEMFGDEANPRVSLIDLIVAGAGLSYGIVVPGENVADGVPMIRPSDFRNDALFLENLYRVAGDIESKFAKTRLNGTEVLVQVIGQPGQIMLTDSRCRGMNVTRNLAVVRPDSTKVDRLYLKVYMQTPSAQSFMLGETKQSTLKQLPLNRLKELPVPLPPLDLQHQFAAFVARTDKQKLTIQHSLAKLETLKKALMQKYFG